jgi:hypothetical protein
MKIMTGVILLAVLSILWSTSSAIKMHRLNILETTGKIPYGPIPDFFKNYYSYDGARFAFNAKLDLTRAEEFTKVEFQELILNSQDALIKKNLKSYIAPTLSFSEEYQIDPFWILAVMMVESGFDKTAKSSKNARGLMQIKDETAEYVYQLMNKNISDEQIQRNLHHPEENIEVGIFYLKKLLQNFKLNYRHATIAYNLGPNKLKSLLLNKSDPSNSLYLQKVEKYYAELSKNYFIILNKKPKPYELSFVARGRGLIFENQLTDIFVTAKLTAKQTTKQTTKDALKSVLVVSSENH